VDFDQGLSYERDDYALRAEAMAKARRELNRDSRGGLSNPPEREPLEARDGFALKRRDAERLTLQRTLRRRTDPRLPRRSQLTLAGGLCELRPSLD
jgi:hypothetical protein